MFWCTKLNLNDVLLTVNMNLDYFKKCYRDILAINQLFKREMLGEMLFMVQAEWMNVCASWRSDAFGSSTIQ